LSPLPARWYGDKNSSASTASTAATTWLEYSSGEVTMRKLEVLKEGAVVAWATVWIFDKVEGQRLVAFPRLHLTADATLDLCAGQHYFDVFRGAYLELERKELLYLLHASFSFWKTGEPELRDVAFVLGHFPLDSSRFWRCLRHGAEMLHGPIPSPKH
jgi:hypothetical protein